MCGIVGQWAKEGFVDNEAIMHGAIIMQSRGRDSTGYMGMNSDGNIVVVKAPIKASSFVEKFKIKGKWKWIALHTRGASCGKVSKDNAHPFKVSDNVVGMHNGFLPHHDRVSRALGLPDREVDSHSLIDLIDCLGANALEEFDRLWWGAVVWWDGRDKKLHIRDNTMGQNMYVSQIGEVVTFSSTFNCTWSVSPEACRPDDVSRAEKVDL